MVSSDENYCVVFNGEIYNFKLLRSELVALGHKFKTSHSDTEILIHGYKEWGKKDFNEIKWNVVLRNF